MKSKIKDLNDEYFNLLSHDIEKDGDTWISIDARK